MSHNSVQLKTWQIIENSQETTSFTLKRDLQPVCIVRTSESVSLGAPSHPQTTRTPTLWPLPLQQPRLLPGWGSPISGLRRGHLTEARDHPDSALPSPRNGERLKNELCWVFPAHFETAVASSPCPSSKHLAAS